MINRHRLIKLFGKSFLTLGVAALALIWMVPVIMMVVVSLMPPDQRAPKYGGLMINSVSMENYKTVFADAPLPQHFVNSLMITIPSVLLVVLVSSLAGYAFARLKFFAKEVWFYLLMLTLMLPIPTLIIPVFQINKAMGLYNTYWGLILPYVAFGVPFSMIILRSFFEGFPRQIEEAAILDGCSTFDIYWRIMLPVSWPAMSVVIIWQFMTSFNEFILALVTIESNSLKPLTLVPLIYSGQFMARPGVMFAVLTLITIPVVVVYYLMQRYMVQGLTAGAVKG